MCSVAATATLATQIKSSQSTILSGERHNRRNMMLIISLIKTRTSIHTTGYARRNGWTDRQTDSQTTRISIWVLQIAEADVFKRVARVTNSNWAGSICDWDYAGGVVNKSSVNNKTPLKCWWSGNAICQCPLPLPLPSFTSFPLTACCAGEFVAKFLWL